MATQADPAKELGLVFTTLDKAVRQHRLYGSRHSQSISALKEMNDRIVDFHQRVGPIKVSVSRDHLNWNDQTVFVLDKKEGNYIQEMYIDGLREFEFTPGITSLEIAGFVSVLGRDAKAYEVREDDTVTLLWKKGFQNIRYQTVDVYATDRFALEEEDLREAENEEEFEREKKYLDRFIHRIVDAEETAKAEVGPIGGASSHHSVFSEDIKKPPTPAFFTLNEEAQYRLTQESERFHQRDPLAEVAPVFCEVLEKEASDESFQALVEQFKRLVQSMLEKGQIKKATGWLKNLRGVQMHVGKNNAAAYEVIEETLQTLATPDLFQKLGERLEKGIEAKPEDWTGLLKYLGKGAVPGICDFLAFVSQETLHTTIVDHLVEHEPTALDIYAEGLKRPEAPVVRDMVRVLGQVLEGQAVLSVLGPVAVHPDAIVRREVVRAMRGFSPEIGRDIFRRALSDRDSTVRMLAIRLVADSRDTFFAKPLAMQIKKEQFGERSPDEKKITLTALARTAGPSALDFLDQVAKEGGSSDADIEFRVAAVQAVSEIDDPRAKAVLQELASKTLLNRSVREAAKILLQRTKPPGASHG